MSRRELMRHLATNGREALREGMRHTHVVNAKTGALSSVPRHNDLKRETARSVCHDLGIPVPPSLR